MERSDVIVVGAGAAGLATALFARQANPDRSVLLLDGAARPGAKILVSGGSRCNVTNAVVSERDYWGGSRAIIRRVLRRLTVPQTIAFFETLGIRLKEEPLGKLFPVTDRSRDVLDALLGGARRAGVTLAPSTRVHAVRRETRGFRLDTSRGPLDATQVVLATGGLSLPKTGSDGAGLRIAERLGHTIVPTTPALAPLVLAEGEIHAPLSGVAHDVELALHEGAKTLERIRGSMLWTHFGISGPAALDLSRHWLRAGVEQRPATVTANLLGGERFEAAERRLLDAARLQPRASLQSVLAALVPASVAAALLEQAQVAGSVRLADLPRAPRRALVHALTALPLAVRDSRGYNYAEATAGGVSLDDIDPQTMASKRCPGLYLVGEMLDVDGRLGGFNFQWAWSSARTAAEALAASP